MDKDNKFVFLFTYVKKKKFSNVYTCIDSRKLLLSNSH